MIELDDKQKQERIAALNELITHPGWMILCEVIEEDLKITEAKLFGVAPLADGETHEQLQRERVDRLELRNLPQNLIREYSEEDGTPPDYDVYE